MNPAQISLRCEASSRCTLTLRAPPRLAVPLAVTWSWDFSDQRVIARAVRDGQCHYTTTLDNNSDGYYEDDDENDVSIASSVSTLKSTPLRLQHISTGPRHRYASSDIDSRPSTPSTRRLPPGPLSPFSSPSLDRYLEDYDNPSWRSVPLHRTRSHMRQSTTDSDYLLRFDALPGPSPLSSSSLADSDSELFSASATSALTSPEANTPKREPGAGLDPFFGSPERRVEQELCLGLDLMGVSASPVQMQLGLGPEAEIRPRGEDSDESDGGEGFDDSFDSLELDISILDPILPLGFGMYPEKDDAVSSFTTTPYWSSSNSTVFDPTDDPSLGFSGAECLSKQNLPRYTTDVLIAEHYSWGTWDLGDKDYGIAMPACSAKEGVTPWDMEYVDVSMQAFWARASDIEAF
ncbi:hypothetical protein BOTBODRAFT_309198 [Botryobasidium botryosum FD-172 SS1]|uniref:Uncharacterized protein n=1 Tax=Botryobasidium botryosum (strain FD-172 SS1) TaxID=930990 RepID=A0A067MXK5_BOTB1|nr:hypothetical protein BOTBODRAFT_309198 [Botryobasidium botryosum FD-172 SS1]